MTPLILFEQTDFASPDETLSEWRRAHPLRPADRVAVVLVPVGIVLSIVLAFAAAALLAMFT